MSAVMQRSELARAPEFSTIVRRNNSLDSNGRLPAFAFTFVVSVGIAGAFAVTHAPHDNANDFQVGEA